MKIAMMQLGSYGTNCYIVWDENTKNAAVIDPGDDVPALDEAIARLALHPEAVLLTHGHFDHLLGAHHIKEAYGAKVYIDKADAPAAENGQRLVLEGKDVLPVHQDLPRGGAVQPAQHMKKRRLAGARRADDGDKFSVFHRQVHAAERVDRGLAAAVNFCQSLGLKDRHDKNLPKKQCCKGCGPPYSIQDNSALCQGAVEDITLSSHLDAGASRGRNREKVLPCPS